MLKVNDWIEVIVAKTGCSKKEAKIVFDCTFDYIKEQISPDEVIKMQGLGVFKIRKTAPKEQINLLTGKPEIVPEHNVVTFKPYFEIDPKPEHIEAVEEEVEEIAPVVPEIPSMPKEEQINWVFEGQNYTTEQMTEILISKTSLTREDITSSLQVVEENMRRAKKSSIEVKENEDTFDFVVLK